MGNEKLPPGVHSAESLHIVENLCSQWRDMALLATTFEPGKNRETMLDLVRLTMPILSKLGEHDADCKKLAENPKSKKLMETAVTLKSDKGFFTATSRVLTMNRQVNSLGLNGGAFNNVIEQIADTMKKVGLFGKPIADPSDENYLEVFQAIEARHEKFTSAIRDTLIKHRAYYRAKAGL